MNHLTISFVCFLLTILHSAAAVSIKCSELTQPGPSEWGLCLGI